MKQRFWIADRALEGKEFKIAAKENHFCFQMSCAKCRWLLIGYPAWYWSSILKALKISNSGPFDGIFIY